MTRQIGSIVPTIFISHLVAVGIAGMIGTPARAADECIAAPNAPSAKGHHWYYRIDRATQRKCWYQRAQDAVAQRPARSAPPPKQRMANAVPAGEPLMKPMAFDQAAAWPEIVPPSHRREAGVAAVQRRDPAGSTQSVDRQDIGLSIATKATATPNETPAQNAAQLAPVAAVAPAATPAPDPEAFTPMRVLLLVIGILVVPGILLRLIFKFGASTRRRIHADREDRKKWSDSVARNWAPTPFDTSEVPPLAPMEPINQVVDAEQLLRKILRELERSAVGVMPDPVSGGSRRYG